MASSWNELFKAQIVTLNDGDKGFFLSLARSLVRWFVRYKLMYGAIHAIYASADLIAQTKKKWYKKSHNSNSCKSNNNRSELATFSVRLFVCLFCCIHCRKLSFSPFAMTNTCEV